MTRNRCKVAALHKLGKKYSLEKIVDDLRNQGFKEKEIYKGIIDAVKEQNKILEKAGQQNKKKSKERLVNYTEILSFIIEKRS